MSLLIDQDFQSFAVGANPPYGLLFRAGVGLPTIGNTEPGLFTLAKYVNMPSLIDLIWPTTAPSTALPAFTEFTVFQFIQILRGQGSDQQGNILLFNCNLNPFAGVGLAAVRILSDGTLAFSCPAGGAGSPNQFVSDDSMLVGSWYTIQTNVRFSSVGAFVGVEVEVGLNNKSVFAGSFVSTQPLAGMPALFVNNLLFGGAGGGAIMGPIVVSDTILPIGAYPHNGVPDVRVSQGAIELILGASGGAPVPLCPVGGGTAIVGQLYNKTLTASGGIAPYSWVVTGLPPGVTFNPLSGQLLGIPTAAGTFTYHATVTDLATATGSVDCTIVVIAELTVDIQFWGVLRFLIPESDAGDGAAEYSAIARPSWRRRLAAATLRAAALLLNHFARKLAPASLGGRLELATAPAFETAPAHCSFGSGRKKFAQPVAQVLRETKDLRISFPLASPRDFGSAADGCSFGVNENSLAQPVAQVLRATKDLGVSVTIHSPRFRFSGGFALSRRQFAQPVAQTLRETNELANPFPLASPIRIRNEKTPAFLRGGV